MAELEKMPFVSVIHIPLYCFASDICITVPFHTAKGETTFLSGLTLFGLDARSTCRSTVQY